MKIFEESDRYAYNDLNADSIVLDCGAYFGNFALEIWKRYHPRIFCFEPISKFATAIREALPPEITVIHRGVGAYARKEIFGVQNDSTGIFAKGITKETVEIESLPLIVAGWDEVALLKLNVEGCEFEILEALTSEELMPKIKHLQVQFHCIVPGAELMRDVICERLEKTHDCVYNKDWVWEGWTRR